MSEKKPSEKRKAGTVKHAEQIIPDLGQAERFLTLLDEEADEFTFQVFSDNAQAFKIKPQVFNGTLNQHADELTRLNRQGAGVFVTINQTDLQGRKEANIKRVRALFVDLDGSPLGPVQNARPEPSIIVESSIGRWHAYWRVIDCDLDQFKPAQKELIERFAADTQVCDLPRVMRLPGFFHRKNGGAHMVRVLEENPRDYSMADFSFGPISPLTPVLTERDGDVQKISSVPLCPSLSLSVSQQVENAINATLPKEEGQREKRLFIFARHLKAIFPDAEVDHVRPHVMEWARRAAVVATTKDPLVTWQEFKRKWPGVHTPINAGLQQILGDIDYGVPIPDELVGLGYSNTAHRLFLVCQRLQEHWGPSSSYPLSCRKAGEVLGIDHTSAAYILKSFVEDGILNLEAKNTTHKATRYRFIWKRPQAIENTSDSAENDQTDKIHSVI